MVRKSKCNFFALLKDSFFLLIFAFHLFIFFARFSALMRSYYTCFPALLQRKNNINSLKTIIQFEYFTNNKLLCNVLSFEFEN
jgi:hypothetical protein